MTKLAPPPGEPLWQSLCIATGGIWIADTEDPNKGITYPSSTHIPRREVPKIRATNSVKHSCVVTEVRSQLFIEGRRRGFTVTTSTAAWVPSLVEQYKVFTNPRIIVSPWMHASGITL